LRQPVSDLKAHGNNDLTASCVIVAPLGGEPVMRHRKPDYRELLKLSEGDLYRRLSDPNAWDPPDIMFAIGISPAPFPEEIRQDRQARVIEHRRVANDLRRLAAAEPDLEKRSKYESAARLNDGLAETLEHLLRDALEDEKTAAEKRAACARELRSLEREQKLLTQQRSGVVLPPKRRRNDKRLGEINQRVTALRERMPQLQVEETKAWARAQPDRQALDDARQMVAEENGRARFKQLEPDIRARLCKQWRACEQVKHYEDEVALTMAVGDVLMTLTATVPVATLAVIVVKIGIKKFCNCP
jgi:hypothetical protein